MAKPFSEEAKEKLIEAYEDVRNDKTETKWCIASYSDDGKLIELTGSGTEYKGFLDSIQDDQRLYAFVRYETGDELSKRAKFAFITWIGPAVSPLKKAKVSTDKAFIKEIFTNFGVEMLADDREDLRETKLKERLAKASGANYGTAR